jgi:hypothetical protein
VVTPPTHEVTTPKPPPPIEHEVTTPKPPPPIEHKKPPAGLRPNPYGTGATMPNPY